MRLRLLAVVFWVGCVTVIPAYGEVPTKAQEKSDSKSNPIVDVPTAPLKVLYAGFEGVGTAWDALGTGEKPPKGSLKGKEDPLPVTEHERQF